MSLRSLYCPLCVYSYLYITNLDGHQIPYLTLSIASTNAAWRRRIVSFRHPGWGSSHSASEEINSLQCTP